MRLAELQPSADETGDSSGSSCDDRIARFLVDRERVADATTPLESDPNFTRLSPLLRGIRLRKHRKPDQGPLTSHIIHQTPDEAMARLRSENET